MFILCSLCTISINDKSNIHISNLITKIWKVFYTLNGISDGSKSLEILKIKYRALYIDGTYLINKFKKKHKNI